MKEEKAGDMREISVVSGASSGLGLEIVRELLARGQSVATLSRSCQEMEVLQDAVASGTVLSLSCDVGDYEQVQRTADTIVSQYSVKYLFNVAGSPAFGQIEEIDGSMLDEALSANLRGVVFLTSQLLESLRCNSPSSIVTVLSTAALTGRVNEGAYAAAKWGARGFMECLKAECKGTGVRTISVFPGGLRTPFWSKQDCLTPQLDGFMDPKDAAKPIVEAAMGIGEIGYVSDLTITRG